MYLKLLLTTTLSQAKDLFPAVLVTGPRQAGKTTFLLHESGKEIAYVSFDDPIERQFGKSDPNGFLDRFADRTVILDEVQYLPEILPYLKMRIDRNRKKNGRWLLTGSQQFQLMKNISESLAGRVALLELLPFSTIEHKYTQLDALIWNGCYPEPALNAKIRELWVRSYIQTYIERDIRQLQNIKDIHTFGLFLGLAAARHSQILNAATLARDVGVSQPTIKSWTAVMEASYLCRLLPPYFKNYGKRLVKTPKLYFLDTAIVCELTRQPNGSAALAGAMGGALFEGLIVSEAVKVFTMLGKSPDIFFWRSHDGLEVDLIIQVQGKLVPVEIKLTATPTEGHAGPLQRFKALAGRDAADTGLVVCRVKEEKKLPFGNIALPWEHFADWLFRLLKG